MNQMMSFSTYPFFFLGTAKMASEVGGSVLDAVMEFKDQGESQGQLHVSLKKYLGLTALTYTSSLNLFSAISV